MGRSGIFGDIVVRSGAQLKSRMRTSTIANRRQLWATHVLCEPRKYAAPRLPPGWSRVSARLRARLKARRGSAAQEGNRGVWAVQRASLWKRRDPHKPKPGLCRAPDGRGLGTWLRTQVSAQKRGANLGHRTVLGKPTFPKTREMWATQRLIVLLMRGG